MAVPSNRVNLCTNPSFEAASGTVNVRTNLVTNPCFEVNTTGWTGTNATIAVSTAKAFSRTKCLSLTATAAAAMSVATATGTAGMPVTAGNSYALQGEVNAAATVRTVTPSISWYNSAGTLLSTSTGTGVANNTTGWTRVSMVVTAPASAAFASVSFSWGTVAASEVQYLDAVLLENSTAVGNYFDGANAASGDYTFGWAGTADASASYQKAPAVASWTTAGNPQPVMSQSTEQASGRTHSTKLWWADGGTSSNTAGRFSANVTAGKAYTLSADVYVPAGMPAVQLHLSDSTDPEVASSGSTTTGAWQRLSVTFTPTITGTGLFDLRPNANTASGQYAYFDRVLIEQSSTAGSYIDGSLGSDANYRYFWDSTADASTSEAEYRGVWVEVGSGSGCPFAQVYVNGTGTSPGAVTVTRQSDDDIVTVPGWNGRSVVDSDTLPDYACPLGRTVTYTAYLNGVQLNSMQLTLNSSTGWVQDPFDPTTAMPVETTLVTTTHLTLAKGSLRNRTHNTNATHGQFMGSARQYSISGQRMMDEATQIILNAWQNNISDAFRELVAGAPIVLFRPLPSWGSIPGLLYMDAPAKEVPLNRDQVTGNMAVTQWDLTGPNVVPVSRMPLTGQTTYNQMATNLANTTYATIASRSSGKRYVDIKANPLSL